MAFTKHTFTDGKTILTAEIMNAIENELVALRKEMALASYPVGAIYMSTKPTNPSSLFGGTWVAWGSGRVPVGVNTSDNDFSSAEKTGGNKSMQAHTHSTPNHKHTISVNTASLTGGAANLSNQSNKTQVNAWGILSVRSNKSDEYYGYSTKNNKGGTDGFTVNASHSHSLSQTASGGGTTGSAGSGSSGNLQPYITCYMFKRTA